MIGRGIEEVSFQEHALVTRHQSQGWPGASRSPHPTPRADASRHHPETSRALGAINPCRGVGWRDARPPTSDAERPLFATSAEGFHRARLGLARESLLLLPLALTSRPLSGIPGPPRLLVGVFGRVGARGWVGRGEVPTSRKGSASVISPRPDPSAWRSLLSHS